MKAESKKKGGGKKVLKKKKENVLRSLSLEKQAETEMTLNIEVSTSESLPKVVTQDLEMEKTPILEDSIK